MKPHRRLNLLTGEWVLVSPHRMLRPWQGKIEPVEVEQRPRHDPSCYLCPNNQRAHGGRNPDYPTTYVFTNDFPALLPHESDRNEPDHQLLCSEPVAGICRVVCFSPRHDLTLAEMDVADIRRVIDTWTAETIELGLTHQWVQVFENKGELMGCSNPHPHGQIWALDTIPTEPLKEADNQRQHHEVTGGVLLLDYLKEELGAAERVVVANEEWCAVVPHWATWPFELLLLPTRHVRRLPDLTDAERDSLSRILKQILVRYDNLFGISFPYSMGWHGAPFDNSNHDHWQLHAHFYPPLLRSASIRKFMVGFELLGEVQRDLTPEQAAARLRALSDIHFNTVPYA